jgi:hypothetical protein
MWIIIWKGCERKRSWPNLELVSLYFLVGLRNVSSCLRFCTTLCFVTCSVTKIIVTSTLSFFSINLEECNNKSDQRLDYLTTPFNWTCSIPSKVVRIIDDELGRHWKEIIMSNFKVLSGNLRRKRYKSRTTFVKISRYRGGILKDNFRIWIENSNHST